MCTKWVAGSHCGIRPIFCARWHPPWCSNFLPAIHCWCQCFYLEKKNHIELSSLRFCQQPGQKQRVLFFGGGLVGVVGFFWEDKKISHKISNDNWVAALFHRAAVDDVRAHVRLHMLLLWPSFPATACQRAVIWGTVLAHAARNNHSTNGWISAAPAQKV